ncbi:MAG: hypothetical protein ACYC4B_32630 [Pirellulaceae bacterium]
MFQLEDQLQEWKRRFDRMEAMRRDDVAELEQHVRDSIVQLTSKGLNAEEAFLIATHRVGEQGEVGKEFGKVNGGLVWAHRAFWMLAGIVVFEVCQMTIIAVASLSQVLALLAGGNGTVMGYASVAVTFLCWIAVATWLYRWFVVQGDRHSGRRLSGTSRGRTIGIGVVLIACVATLMKFGSQIAVSRMTSVADLGQAALISAWANALFAVLIPLAALFVTLMIRQRIRETVTVEQ